MKFIDAEAVSKEEALREVARHLSKPEQLDRLDQYKRERRYGGTSLLRTPLGPHKVS